MSFLHLYKFAEGLAAASKPGHPPVEVEAIKKWIIDAGIATEIEVYAVSIDRDLSPGHVIVRDFREDRHDDADLRADVRIFKGLNTCWVRFVSCKEMMHLFDSDEEAVNERHKFFTLMDELDAPPPPSDQSAMLNSEYDAEWMALLLLAPKPLRDEYRAKLVAEEITVYDVAWKFRIPQLVVRALMSDRYDQRYKILVTDAEEPEPADPNEPKPA
ncbi:hypothetical protein [Brevundimonas sp. 'scallop']|jgi:hypothetical protein|uniref:hypothetical protein n=1 Tax=Brevundimonas sp. 'scallop' TaxID=2562582 RepID=UPI0013E19277|nr:hypothetical protein [Brevundimonas sp. 'scallop']QIF82574.1 hypothetical protein E4341_13240 [Brevundimonas sp. 'scallop']